MRTFMSLFATLSICAGLTSSACAQGTTYPSLKSLVSDSSLIVAGVGSVQTTGSQTITTTVKVLRTVKGNTPVNDSITVNAGPCSDTSGSGELIGLWVVKPAADGNYTLAEPLKGESCRPLGSSLETSSAKPLLSWAGIPTPSNDIDKLALELAWSVHQHQGKGPFLAILNPAFLDDASKDVQTALGHALYTSTNPEEHRIGLITLLKMGDLTALAEVGTPAGSLASAMPTSYLLNDRSVPVRFGSSKDPWIGLRLSQIISDDDRVVRSLIVILNSNADLPTRTGAAEALRRVHSATATNALLPYLNSEIKPLRYAAIGAVSCYVNAVPVIDPSALYGGFDLNKDGPFKTADTALHFGFSEKDIQQREDFYLSFWKAWVLAHPSAFTS